MSPEEKAKWLIEEMKGGCCRCPQDSKYAAITCCDEIIQEISGLPEMPDGWSVGSIKEYWQQVKQEIETI